MHMVNYDIVCRVKGENKLSLIKAAGLVVIFAVLLYGGFSIGFECRDVCRRLDGLCRLVCFIRSRIECYNQPLYEIYKEFEDDALEDCGFLEKLRNEGFSSALERYKDIETSEELIHHLSEFSSQLGRSLSSEQIKNCDAMIYYLNECLCKERERLPQKIKLIKAVSVAVAAMVVIVLI